jgi:DNA-binding NarL/FixJ family response regulator
MQTSLLIADAYPVVLHALASTFKAIQGIHLLGAVTSYTEVIVLCQSCHPTILILDATLPDRSVIDTIDVVHNTSPNTKIAIFSTMVAPEVVYALFACGIDGYILKETPLPTIIEALVQIQAGEVWFSPQIARLLVSFVSGRNTPIQMALNDREKALLTHLVAGQSDREIAYALCIKVTTVRYHLKKLFERLGLRSRVDLAVKAVQQGWLQQMLSE